MKHLNITKFIETETSHPHLGPMYSLADVKPEVLEWLETHISPRDYRTERHIRNCLYGMAYGGKGWIISIPNIPARRDYFELWITDDELDLQFRLTWL